MTRPDIRAPRRLARIAQFSVAIVALANIFFVQALASYQTDPSGAKLLLVGEIGSWYVMLYTAAAIIFLSWFRRCRSNAEAFSPGTATYSQGWAIGAWFTPVLNLWRPRRITLDIIRASEPSAGAAGVGTGLVNTWWAAWTADLVIVTIERVTRVGTPLALRLALEGLPIIAAALIMIIIQKLTTLQRTKIGIIAQPQHT